MNKKEYKKIVNSQRLAEEIKFSSMCSDKKSDVIKEFVTTNSEISDQLIRRLNDDVRINEMVEIIGQIDSKKSTDLLFRKIDKNAKRRRLSFVRKALLIASAVIAVCFLIWDVVDKFTSDTLPIDQFEEMSTNNPILKLSTGKTYELVQHKDMASDQNNDYIVAQSMKMSMQQLRQRINKDSVSQMEDSTLFMELTVPERKTYTVVLPDGSEVKLNASSRLRYPERFVGANREVSVEGEAFFTIKKSDTPFVVKTKNSYIKVYGTRFNVNTRDSDEVKTVLVDGVVGVGFGDGSEQIMKPNQMAIVNTKQKSCSIKSVNTNNYLGWMFGSIICMDGNLKQLFAELEAWYGIEIKCGSHSKIVDETIINIMIKHSMQIEEVMNLIEKVTDVKFINEGGYYTLMIE